MVDNVVANPGVGGATFLSEDVGSGVQAPIAKMAFGVHGVATPVDGDNPLPVSVADGSEVVVSGTVALDAPTLAALETVSVGNFPATQAVSVTALPLPTGASTSANQTITNTKLDQIHADLTAPLPAGTNNIGAVTVVGGNTAAIKVDGSAVTQPVSAAALPLPAGASTEATLAAVSGKLPATLGSKVSASSLSVVLASDQVAVPVTGTFFQATQPVSAAALPLPAGAATSALQITGNASLSTLVAVEGVVTPAEGASALAIRNTPQATIKTSFTDSVASGTSSSTVTTLHTGTGQTVSQSNSNLVITSGTTVNAESIIRTNASFYGSFTFKAQSQLSQRIANNSFVFELVDVIGDNIPITVNSATSVTLDFTTTGITNPFAAVNVGQGVNINLITGIAIAPPQRGVIASVSGQQVTFTVAGFSTSGTGTASLNGWNYHQFLYNGTVVTTAQVDCQRRGWNSGNTAATTNTTAAPGHMPIINSESGTVLFADQLVASATAVQVTPRASRNANVPDNATPLFLQIRCFNGTVAPATTTTWTIGMIQVEEYAPQQVSLTSARPQSQNAALPVSVSNTVSTTLVSPVFSPTMAAAVNSGTTAQMLPATLVSAATTNATLVKTGSSRLVGGLLYNTSAAVKYLKLFNKATVPVPGTDTPVWNVAIPVGGSADLSALVSIYAGTFPLGLGYAITGAAALLDATAVAAGDVILNLNYV